MNKIIKIAMLIALLVATVKVQAQDKEPLLKEGRSWIRIFYDPYIEDMEIDGIYVKWTVEDYEDISDDIRLFRISKYNLTLNEQFGNVYLYEKDGVLYFRYKDEYYPVIDLSVMPGEKIKDSYPVLANCFTTIRGKERKVVVMVYDSYLEENCYWIDGIGTTWNVYYTVIPYKGLVPLCHNYNKLFACYDGEECIYQDGDLAGFSEVLSKTSEIPKDGIYYDLHGRQVKKPQPGSIYIRNGKKTVF